MKKRNNSYYYAVVCCTMAILPGPLRAQAPMKLPLSEAISMSLQNSGQMKIANEKVNEASAMYHEATNNRLPDIKVTGSYLRLNAPNVNLKLKTGNTTQESGQSTTSSPKVEQAAYGLVNASLPLFSGLRIKNGIAAAKYMETAARFDAERDREDIVRSTIVAYSNLYKAKKSVELVRENLVREEKRVADFRNLEKNGLLPRNDLLKAQLQQSNIELALLEAESNQKMASINLALALGLPEGTSLMPDSNGMDYPADAGTKDQWETLALENRKDRAALAARANAAMASLKATKGEYYPGIALTGGYIAADVPNLLTLTNALNVGIGLQYNFSSLWKTGAKADAAKARLHQLQASEGILADRVRLEINNAYQEYLLSIKKISVFAKSVEQATENYRITKNKYDNNLVTTTELLEADVAQLQATLNYTFSKTDAMVAYKNLQLTAGIMK